MPLPGLDEVDDELIGRSLLMNLVRIAMMLALSTVLSSVGCAGHQPFPESSLTGGVLEVKIDEMATPTSVTAKRGDEIRWINMSKMPVDVSVVQTREELISCQKGFASTNLGYLFATSEYENIVMATVQPNEFASLCFAISGKYAYTVRMHPTASANKVTGSIIVE
jgi:plastocyanin